MASSLNWLSKSRLGQARKESISLVQLFEHAGLWLTTVEQKILSFEGPRLSNLTFLYIDFKLNFVCNISYYERFL